VKRFLRILGSMWAPGSLRMFACVVYIHLK